MSASFPIGSYLNTGGNEMIPSVTAGLLSKGTTKNDKFEFSQKLEKLGVNIRVSAGTHNTSIGFKCLKQDISTVIDLLAEELRYPLFDAKELDILKQQWIGGMQQGLSDPNQMGSIALSQAIYPEGHPNYSKDIKASIEDVKNVSIEDIKAFHKTYFGPAGMHLVAVGDVDSKVLYQALEAAFKNWNGGVTSKVKYTEPDKSKAKAQVVTIPEKPSAELFIGRYTGLKRSDADYIPFFIANHTFGGGFSGRLMRTVRDEDGLTYSISSSHSGHTYSGGNWSLNASFNPELFQKGLDATMVQLKKWMDEGITAKELGAKKSNLIGSFKVGMATTGGLANTILSVVERGQDPGYIDRYPTEIDAVTLDQVNSTIKKYIDINGLVIIKSGSLDENGEPLK